MAPKAAASETPSDKAWGFLMGWIGRITAIVGFCATVAGGVTWIITHHHQQRERTAQLALAETQAKQGDYQTSVETYAAILKADPLDRAVLEDQLNAAMLWAENFSVLIPDGQSATDVAGRPLDEMTSILESGLTRSKGTRAADVQAHLGWAHWLNQHIAEREFGPAAEQNLRAALTTDPDNVYGNAMLGNWMLQNGGSFDEAIQHLNRAVATGKARPLVRGLQIGGLTGDDRPGARRELMKAVNAMRVHGEAIDPDERYRIFGFCCDLVVTDHRELNESLSAVPPQDAWETYLWLENAGSITSPDPIRPLVHEYIQANLLEISGQTPQALRQYQALQLKLRDQPSMSLREAVDAAVRRLSHS